ncbi:hypothetical protein GPL21_33255 [Bradyrhizobium pachyrhizi]|uniref:Nucleoside 2-deoxyribosyltransferase n=1 Tax=Bradyrhizobium pachyrhizi TaxID=280333 RepID=A0A844SVD1_9BRAD|nr:hypothetical protein [Bradyrhizobium pachyrhizi]MVT69956.1 hypothetical protein [Bradyrhizobium pachyrhizi]
MPNCPVCETPDATGVNDGAADVFRVVCLRCGEFALAGTAHAILITQFSKGKHRRALMSHALCRMGASSGSGRLVIASNMLDSFWPTERLPTPQKQANDLLLYLGDNQSSPESSSRTKSHYLGAWIGTTVHAHHPHDGLLWILGHLRDTNLLKYSTDTIDSKNPVISATLTMQGWERYEELKKVQSASRTAFMAMRFGQPKLDDFVENVFKPAVLRTGFELRKLTDEQPAGLIDDQIRAAILSARFVIADLTHGSHGAYWEAGFAEGLNLPVIYTCEKSAWDDTKTHFDTNHLLTIVWDPADPTTAGNQLAATIRATLRTEAKQQDS